MNAQTQHNDITFAPGGCLLTDLDGIIQQIDHGVSVLFQTASRRIQHRPLSLFVTDESREILSELGQIAIEQQVVAQGRVDLLHRDEMCLPVTVAVNAVVGVDAQPTGLHWLIRMENVSSQDSEIQTINERLKIELRERHKAEAEAHKRERELQALHRATVALLSTLDLQGLLGQILDALTSALPVAEKGTVHLIARDTGQLEMRAAIGYTDPRIQKIAYSESSGYIARAVRGRRPLLIDDLHHEPSMRYSDQISEMRDIQSVIAAPLIHPSGEVLGALSLESSQKSAFDDDDLQLLTSFAATATTAIYNAQLHAEVQKLAITDALTGLYNRRGFDELGHRELERVRRFGNPLSAMMIDVDDFKLVNDTHGHKIGDQVIRAVATRLVASLREVDIVGRFGGDEFTILLPETDIYTAHAVAERLLKKMSELPIVTENVAVNLTISIGVIKASNEIGSLNVLIEKADQALYQAKNNGRNQVVMIDQ